MSRHRVQCPHCGGLMGHPNLARHVHICLDNPEVRARVRAAMINEDGTTAHYQAYAARTNTRDDLPSVRVVSRRFGGYDHALEALGLPPPPADYRRKAQQKRPVSRAEQEACFAELDAAMEQYIAWVKEVNRAEKYGLPLHDTSAVQVQDDGSIVRTFANGARWEMPKASEKIERIDYGSDD